MVLGGAAAGFSLLEAAAAAVVAGVVAVVEEEGVGALTDAVGGAAVQHADEYSIQNQINTTAFSNLHSPLWVVAAVEKEGCYCHCRPAVVTVHERKTSDNYFVKTWTNALTIIGEVNASSSPYYVVKDDVEGVEMKASGMNEHAAAPRKRREEDAPSPVGC